MDLHAYNPSIGSWMQEDQKFSYPGLQKPCLRQKNKQKTNERLEISSLAHIIVVF